MTTKKNVSLIMGIAIPICMIVLVAASIYLPGVFSPPPKFNFLYVMNEDYYESQQYFVENGILVKREVTYPNAPRGTPSVARLFVHDVAKNESKEISFEGALKLHLDPNVKSPDGFEVVYGSRGAGIFPLFFSSSEDYNTLYIKGHHANRKLNMPSRGTGRYSYYDGRFRFLGWIK